MNVKLASRLCAAGAALALLAAGAAAAAEYVVVASTDPAIPKGRELASGQKLPLGPGRTVTVMHASGSVTTLKGAAGGVTLPRRSMSAADEERMAVLRLMVSAPPKTSRTRSLSPCPDPQALTTLDLIAEVGRNPQCQTQATAALDAWLAQAPADEN